MRRLVLVLFVISRAANAPQAIPKHTSLNLHKRAQDKAYIQIAAASASLGIKQQSKVVYSVVGKRKSFADVINPVAKSKQGYPTVVMVFGGGCKSGDRWQNMLLRNNLQQEVMLRSQSTIDYHQKQNIPQQYTT
jgi:hypothetical protein